MDSEKTEMSSVKGEENMTFEELCVKMQSKLKKYIYHKTKNIHRTEDILQNVFFTAVKKRNEVLSHPKPEGWLFNAARNLVLKDYEKNKRIEENEVELLDVMVAEESFGEEHEIIAEEIYSELSDNEKLIIEYHYGEDLALKEIAVILGENYETLKKRHFRLLKKVGKLYEKIKVKKN